MSWQNPTLNLFYYIALFCSLMVFTANECNHHES